MRTKIAGIALIATFLFLGSGLFNLEVMNAARFRQLSNKNCIRLLPQPGSRGRILDRLGNVLVDNRLYYDVSVISQDDSNLEAMLGALAPNLGTNSRELRERFKNNYAASFVPTLVAQDIDLKKAIAIEELRPLFGGIIIQPRVSRAYPHGRLACHILGYLSEIDSWRLTKLAAYGYQTKDIVGFGGVEERYDYYLRQANGGLSFEVDSLGRRVRTLGFKPPANGKDIKLTINLKVQKIAEDVLDEKKGCVIIMEPATGEIIAMASRPDFSPTAFSENKLQVIRGVLGDPEAPLINRGICGVYPAGSVFKIIVASAGLQTGKVVPSTTFLCTGGTLVGRERFACWASHGQQNLIAAIAHSCNVFFYKAGLLLGGQAIYDYATKFGLAKVTGVDLPYEAAGFVPSPLWKRVHKFKSWFDGDTANLSIGQGELLASPLQMARAMAVFANKGFLVTPYIVSSVDNQDISLEQRKITRLPLKNSTIDYIRRALAAVVSDRSGTANVLSGLAVSVAGKTGTAQAPGGQPHAWFTGFFPFEHPRFVICVFLEHAGPGYLASVSAKEIIERMIQEGLV